MLRYKSDDFFFFKDKTIISMESLKWDTDFGVKNVILKFFYCILKNHKVNSNYAYTLNM